MKRQHQWQQHRRRKEPGNPLRKLISWTRPPLVEREIQFNRFREALGEERLASFLAYLREKQEIHACVLLDQGLNEGNTLLSLVLTAEPHVGYCFSFRKFPGDRWSLGFGYTLPFAGDFGIWTVIFDPAGKIVRIRLWRESIG